MTAADAAATARPVLLKVPTIALLVPAYNCTEEPLIFNCLYAVFALS